MRNKSYYGWVYLLKCLPNYYKVGITSNSITGRMLNYKTHNPYKLKIVELIYVNNYRNLEKKLHNKYFNIESSIKSDWFVLDKETVIKIQKEMIDFQMENAVIPDYKKNLL